MNIYQSYIRAFGGQTIHRNGLWLYERIAEDVPDAYTCNLTVCVGLRDDLGAQSSPT